MQVSHFTWGNVSQLDRENQKVDPGRVCKRVSVGWSGHGGGQAVSRQGPANYRCLQYTEAAMSRPL